MEVSSEIRESIEKLTEYNFSDEQTHYEEEYDVEITDDDYSNPDGLEHKGHIFYHILVLNQFLNQ